MDSITKTPDSPTRTGGRLSPEEARRLTDQARNMARDLWRLVRRLYEEDAHVALGYATFAEYFNRELRGLSPGERFDPKYPHKVLRAAYVEAEVSVHVDTGGMRESQARVLATVKDPEVRLKLVKRCLAIDPWSDLTVASMKHELAAIRGKIVEHDSGSVHIAADWIEKPARAPRLAWNLPIADEMASALSYLRHALWLLSVSRPPRYRHFILPEALRDMPIEDARAVRKNLERERQRVEELGFVISDVAARLDFAAQILDGRLGEPPPEMQFTPITVEEAIADVAHTPTT